MQNVNWMLRRLLSHVSSHTLRSVLSGSGRYLQVRVFFLLFARIIYSGIALGPLGNILIMTSVIFPSVDAIMIIIFIPAYRQSVTSFIMRRFGTANVVNVGNNHISQAFSSENQATLSVVSSTSTTSSAISSSSWFVIAHALTRTHYFTYYWTNDIQLYSAR